MGVVSRRTSIGVLGLVIGINFFGFCQFSAIIGKTVEKSKNRPLANEQTKHLGSKTYPEVVDRLTYSRIKVDSYLYFTLIRYLSQLFKGYF